MDASNIIALAAGVALFLFGMTLMGDGLKKVAGNRLELVLYKLSGSPLKGVLLGTGVTAIIQSSSATSVMVVGFVNSGMMKVDQAIGIVMGAILGTSVTGWIICLSALEGVTLLGAQDAPHIVNLAVAGVRSQGLINVLQGMGFCVSAGSACSKGHRSHVLEAMGVAPALIDGSIRVSLSAENTMQEMDDFADALPRAVAALR